MDVFVNGVSIPEHHIDAEAQYHPASSRDESRQLAARSLVIRELLLQEARRLGLEVGDADSAQPEEDQLIQVLLDREVKLPSADETSCRRFFAQNREKFSSETLFEVSHVLVAADPADPVARDAAQEKAQALLAQIQSQPDSFPSIAAAHSDCPSARSGGNLGQIGRGQTVPEFERALRGLADGEIAPRVIESRYGFHLIYLHKRLGGEPLPYEGVAHRIGRYLDESVARRAVRQYLSVLIGRAQISGIDLQGADSPLLQ